MSFAPYLYMWHFKSTIPVCVCVSLFVGCFTCFLLRYTSATIMNNTSIHSAYNGEIDCRSFFPSKFVVWLLFSFFFCFLFICCHYPWTIFAAYIIKAANWMVRRLKRQSKLNIHRRCLQCNLIRCKAETWLKDTDRISEPIQTISNVLINQIQGMFTLFIWNLTWNHMYIYCYDISVSVNLVNDLFKHNNAKFRFIPVIMSESSVKPFHLKQPE